MDRADCGDVVLLTCAVDRILNTGLRLCYQSVSVGFEGVNFTVDRNMEAQWAPNKM